MTASSYDIRRERPRELVELAIHHTRSLRLFFQGCTSNLKYRHPRYSKVRKIRLMTKRPGSTDI
jgi:hypothetical protein